MNIDFLSATSHHYLQRFFLDHTADQFGPQQKAGKPGPAGHAPMQPVQREAQEEAHREETAAADPMAPYRRLRFNDIGTGIGRDVSFM